MSELPKYIKHATARVRTLIDVRHPSFRGDEQVREALSGDKVMLYLQSWVLPLLDLIDAGSCPRDRRLHLEREHAHIQKDIATTGPYPPAGGIGQPPPHLVSAERAVEMAAFCEEVSNEWRQPKERQWKAIRWDNRKGEKVCGWGPTALAAVIDAARLVGEEV